MTFWPLIDLFTGPFPSDDSLFFLSKASQSPKICLSFSPGVDTKSSNSNWGPRTKADDFSIVLATVSSV